MILVSPKALHDIERLGNDNRTSCFTRQIAWPSFSIPSFNQRTCSIRRLINGKQEGTSVLVEMFALNVTVAWCEKQFGILNVTTRVSRRSP